MEGDKFLLILLAVFGFLSFLILRPFLSYILFGVILTAVSYPLYEKIKSKIKIAPLAAVLVILLLVLLIIIPSIYVGIVIFTQSRELVSQLSTLELTELKSVEEGFSKYLGIDINLINYLNVWLPALAETSKPYIFSNIVSVTKTILNFFVGIFLMVFVMFYFFIDGRKLVYEIKKHFPIDEKHKTYLLQKAYLTTQGLFLGLFFTAIIQGILAGLGYFVFGIPNAILWGFVTAAFSILPFLGPPAVYIPASIFLIFQNNLYGGLGLLIYGFVIISNIDTIVRPHFVRITSDIHPLKVILGVIGGVSLIGISGIVIGPLILALFVDIFETYHLIKHKKK